MRLFSSAATSAAAITGIVLLAGSTAPGFAVELETNKVPVVSPLQAAAEPKITDRVIETGGDAIVTPTDGATVDAAGDASVPASPQTPVSFASLADAIAAQPMPAEIDSELRCLAAGVYFEARSESQDGQLAVAEVILNRADSGRFPKTVCGVVTQPGQFSFVRGGKLPAIDTSRPMWRTAVKVAQVARQRHWESPAAEAMFFHARRVSPGWRLSKVAAVGNHVFYR